MFQSGILKLFIAGIAITMAACQTSPSAPEKEKLSSAEIMQRRQQTQDMSKQAIEK